MYKAEKVYRMVTHRKKAGIIGAGISGLATAKVLKADGFEMTVFEKAP